MRVLVLVSVLLLAGCAPLATFKVSDEIDMEIHAMSSDARSYSARVKFIERTRYPEVIQEGFLVQEQQRFVEKFPADDRTYSDRHWASNVSAPGLQRILRVYVGRTQGTLDTVLGFAMLPMNKDGSVITNTGLDFNAAYRRTRLVLLGRVVEQSPVVGEWSLEWYPHRLVIRTADGSVTYAGGEVTVSRP